jgi:hypothetical protein
MRRASFIFAIRRHQSQAGRQFPEQSDRLRDDGLERPLHA